MHDGEKFDDVTCAVLDFYLMVSKENRLNKNGISLSTKKDPTHFTIYVDVDNESEAELAKKLRSIANTSSTTSLTQCTSQGSPEVVHKSNQNYNRRSTIVEMRPFEVKATTQLTNVAFKRYCADKIKK